MIVADIKNLFNEEEFKIGKDELADPKQKG